MITDKFFELSLVTCEKTDCPLLVNINDIFCKFCGMARIFPKVNDRQDD